MIKVSDETIRKANEIPLTVGRAAIAWNTVQHSIFQLFEILSGLDLESAKSVYFAVKSDRNQRDMVTELVNHKIKPKNPKLAAKVRSVLGSVDSLSGRRNETLHVVYVDSLDGAKTRLLHDVGHLKGKIGQELIVEIHKTTMELLDCAIDLERLNREITPFLFSEQKKLIEGLLLNNPLRNLAGETNQGGFGLLGDFPKKSPHAES